MQIPSEVSDGVYSTVCVFRVVSRSLHTVPSGGINLVEKNLVRCLRCSGISGRLTKRSVAAREQRRNSEYSLEMYSKSYYGRCTSYIPSVFSQSSLVFLEPSVIFRDISMTVQLKLIHCNIFERLINAVVILYSFTHMQMFVRIHC